MVDHVDRIGRSAIMSKVGTRDTWPEMTVRRALHRRGYRYVLNDKRLPGSPDLVFPRRRKVIFVHGCFWHGHECKGGRLPKSRVGYWSNKVVANKARDATTLVRLADLGWKSLVLWQCEVRKMEAVLPKVVSFLEGNQ